MAYNDLRKGRYSQTGGEYFITTVVNGRRPLFADFQLARCFIHELAHSQLNGHCQWLAWVLMPDHFHGLLQLQHNDLSNVIKKLKGRSARRINEYLYGAGDVGLQVGLKPDLQENGQRPSVWQANFYDHALRTEENRVQIARYIVANRSIKLT